MLQCTLTFLNNNSETVVRRVSNEDRALTNYYWDPFISSLSPVKNELTKPYGGREDVSVGSINLIPTVFDGQGSETGYTWPPPAEIEVLIEYGDDDTIGNKTVLFAGIAYYTDMNRADIRYKLYALLPSYKVRSLKIDQDLNSLFADFVTLWSPAYTLDTTYAASPSPYVDIITPSSEMLFIDVLADICEYNGHFFSIDDVAKTVRLVSMDISNGTGASITEFDYQPSVYNFPSPIRSVKVGESNVVGDFQYGNKINFSNICIPDAYLKIGDNSGNDQVWMVHKGNNNAGNIPAFIAYDSTKLYRYTLKYRKKVGTHNIYGGFHGMKSLTESNNIYGVDTYTSQSYVFSRAGDSDDKWHTVTGYMTGYAAQGTFNSGAPDGTTINGTVPALVAHEDTVYIRPLILVNHNSVAGETDIAYCAIHEIEFDPTNAESDGGVVETLFEYKADYFDPTEWQFYTGSSDPVESSAQEAIDNILLIANKHTVSLKLPLEAVNVYSIGQEITWTDEAQHRGVEAAIKVRSINYDFNNEDIYLVGEGTLVEML